MEEDLKEGDCIGGGKLWLGRVTDALKGEF